MVSVPGASAPSTNPLTRHLAELIGNRWTNGAGFAEIADDLVDALAEHIRTAGVHAIDPRIADAMADAIRDHHESDHAPADAPAQQRIDYETAVAAGHSPEEALTLARREALVRL